MWEDSAVDFLQLLFQDLANIISRASSTDPLLSSYCIHLKASNNNPNTTRSLKKSTDRWLVNNLDDSKILYKYRCDSYKHARMLQPKYF